MLTKGTTAVLLALVLLLVASACTTQPVPTPSPFPTDRPSTPRATHAPPPATPTPSPEPLGPTIASPFTVLLLGADHEERTDVVMVVGIDPASRSVSLASIPRDTVNVPLPGGGAFRNQKINAFYNYAQRNSSTYPQGAARATADVVETLLGIEIDYYAKTTFQGFVNLTKAMGGVEIELPKAVVDPYYQVTSTDVGVRFPAGRQTLDGDRALIFVRTRQGDNDFERQRRQQLFLVSAARQVLGRPALLDALLSNSRNVQTDFPLAEMPTLVQLVGSLDEWSFKQVVLGPRRYASAGSCSCGYSLEPDVAEMRKLARSFFPWAIREVASR